MWNRCKGEFPQIEKKLCSTQNITNCIDYFER